MSTDLPAEITYGHVVGRIILAVGDGPDEGRLPDAVAAEGQVNFTPKSSSMKTTSPPAHVLPRPVACTLDSQGYLIDPQGKSGVWLVAGQYNVTYSFRNVNVPRHDIVVTTEHTEEAPLDLALAMPPAGPVLAPSQYAALSARIDQMGSSGSGVEVLTNPATIPTDVTRLDLVFTQPTTVSFDDPGQMDITVSIEGYEHVTWGNVAVHGTPDASGVVWASALWRERSSAWHLLCEQGASSGGVETRLHEWSIKNYEVTFDENWEPERGDDGFPVYSVKESGDMGYQTEFVMKTPHPTLPDAQVERYVDLTRTNWSDATYYQRFSMDYLNVDATEGFFLYGDLTIEGNSWSLSTDTTLAVLDVNAVLRQDFVILPPECLPPHWRATFRVRAPSPGGGAFILQVDEGMGLTLRTPHLPLPEPGVDPEFGLPAHRIAFTCSAGRLNNRNPVDL